MWRHRAIYGLLCCRPERFNLPQVCRHERPSPGGLCGPPESESEVKQPAWQRKQQELRRVSALEAENWNLKYPVGTPVVLSKDSGEQKQTKTRSEAYVCDSGQAVCFFEGVSGYYLLDRATPAREVQP